MKVKTREKQINFEAKITLGLYFIYFAWWYYFAYSTGEDPSQYIFILGLPYWFFMSCIVGFVLINLLVFLAVKFLFKDIDLD
ncbi:MAG: YhdT family protein [Fusobacteriaceae bacterium]